MRQAQYLGYCLVLGGAFFDRPLKVGLYTPVKRTALALPDKQNWLIAHSLTAKPHYSKHAATDLIDRSRLSVRR